MRPPDSQPDNPPGTRASGAEPGVRRRILGGLTGIVVGALAGLVLSLALVVARAVLEEVFLHELEDIVGWPAIPLGLLPAVGAVLGTRLRLASPATGAAFGAALGAVAGGLGGAVFFAEPPAPWAGAVMGAGAGVLVGGALAPLAPGRWAAAKARRFRHAIPRWARRALAATVLVAAGSAVAAQLGADPEPLPPAGAIPAPDTAGVSTVVFFVGDPGEATFATYPVLARLRQDVERWSTALESDGEVAVVYLGDLVYPSGLPPRDAPGWPEESRRVADQVEVVAGPAARARGARALFVAGNHDWGQEEDWEGAVRVVRLGELLAEHRAEGIRVSLEPEAGTGGPSVVDLGDRLRLVLLDTAWWLLEGERESKDAVVAGVEAAIRDARDRNVVVAAHHPFVSTGPHGGLADLGSTLGIRALLARSGAMLQDLYSEPYRELRNDLLAVFRRTRPPVLFAGGHEHSLQVVRTEEPGAPRTSVVSGSASKLTGVEARESTLFARSAPGYALLLVRRDGALELRIDAAPARFLACPDSAGAANDPESPRVPARETTSCLRRGVEAYRTVWAGPV